MNEKNVQECTKKMPRNQGKCEKDAKKSNNARKKY